jgi:hypothetical protein
MSRKKTTVRKSALAQDFATLGFETYKLIDRAKFLVRRAEFLYQTRLLVNAQAEEIFRDRQTLEEWSAKLIERLDALRARADRGIAAKSRAAKSKVRKRRK